MSLDWTRIRKVLIMRLDNIGDVIMTAPCLRALREFSPRMELTLMASPAGSQAAPLLPWVDNCWTETVVWQDAFAEMPLAPAREIALVRRLREGTFDAALILTSFSQSPYPPAYACYLAGIPVRIGQSREFGGSLLSHWIKPPPDDTHQALRNLNLLAALGVPIAGGMLSLEVPPPAARRMEQWLGEKELTEQRYILAAPGASCQARTYPLQRFMEVIDRLPQLTGVPVVVAGSEQETAIRQAASESERRGEVVSAVGATSVPELAYLVQKACLVVTNDSAAMHLADAFQTPMVVLFSGTDMESQWRPRAAIARLLRRPTDCAPCYLFRCPINLPCLDFSPAEVAAEVQDLFQSIGFASPPRAEASGDGLCDI